jgi:asparagine synthase (glutamine-hydrolysing)
MCGIAGILSRHEAAGAVKLATDALRHRGPDDVGIAQLTCGANVSAGSFGHRRLSIIDLSTAGHQPMFSVNGRLCITYNGEIYNYRELRDELSREGARFRGGSDTEVLLMGWAMHGPAILRRLRGMFALAIWDRQRGRGYLARDSFGIKPLYVAERGGSIVFASEIRALLASGLVPRRILPAALTSYLATGSVAEPDTIIAGIRAVPAGCVVEVAIDGDRMRLLPPRAFAPLLGRPVSQQLDLDLDAAATKVRESLRESVRYHLVSDVPVALFLSGGLDSSSVVALASEVADSRLETFTITFAERGFSEAAPAMAVARRFQTSHHEIPLSGQDLLNALPDVFAAMDQPSMDGLNTYVVSRAVRAYGIKVVLSGLGGDELFAGYPSFQRASIIAPFWKLPAVWRRILAGGFSRLSDPRVERVNLVLKGSAPAEAAYAASRTLFGARQAQALVNPAEMRGQPSSELSTSDFKLIGPGFGLANGESEISLRLLQQVSVCELNGYMRNTLLRDSDVFSMAHGLELRVPMLDREVLESAMLASDAAKLKRGVSKPLLVAAVRDLLPPEVLARPKQGFTLPFETWMRRELFDEVNGVLTSGSAKTIGLDASAVRDVWRDFQARRSGTNWSRPWALYTLMRWAAQNDVELDDSVFAVDTAMPLPHAG